MNIIQFMDYNASYEGNFMYSLFALERKIKSHGDEVIYVFLKKSNNVAWINKITERGIKVYFNSLSTIKDILDFRKIVKNNKVDIIHTHFLHTKVHLKLLFLLPSLKIIRHLHSDIGNINFYRKLGYLKTYQICCSTHILNSVKINNCIGKGAFLVENAINFSRLDFISDDDEIINFFENNKFKIMSFGYDIKIKGVDLLIDALMAINNPNILLYIAVAGNKETVEKYLTETYGKILEFIILLPARNDIGTYYSNIDLFVSMSRTEGFSYAIREAAYCKKRIILSNIPAQIDDALIYSYYVESENIDKLIECLQNVIYEEPNIEQLEIQKQLVVEKYSIERWASKIYSIYKKINKKEVYQDEEA